MDNDSKLQAAIAGVMYYMMTEEEQQPAVAEKPATGPAAWALNGRQTIMQWRTLVQRRVLKR